MSVFTIRLAVALTALTLTGIPLPAAAVAPAPMGFDVVARPVVLTVHAEGAQIYQCQPDASGALAWAFREPIATLISNGKTIGRHYAGPTWALDDGSAVKGKLAAIAPGAARGDIPQLKLTVVEHRGVGVLADANLVLRLNTHGGAFEGACAVAGELHAEPYSADYAFLR
jgi:hypothetical protein